MAGAPDEALAEQGMRAVFQVEGTLGRDPFAGTPVFTPLESVRGAGGKGWPDPALAVGRQLSL